MGEIPMRTEYVVLHHHDGAWRELQRVSASSAMGAVRQVADGTEAPAGRFVAVPTRSWQPVGVEVITVRQLKLKATA